MFLQSIYSYAYDFRRTSRTISGKLTNVLLSHFHLVNSSTVAAEVVDGKLTYSDVVHGKVKCTACWGDFDYNINVLDRYNNLAKKLRMVAQTGKNLEDFEEDADWIKGPYVKCPKCNRRKRARPIIQPEAQPNWTFLLAGWWIGLLQPDQLKDLLTVHQVNPEGSTRLKLVSDAYTLLLGKLTCTYLYDIVTP